MPRYSCKICQYVLTTSSTPGRCPRCGNLGESNWEKLHLPPLHLDAKSGFLVIFEEEKTLGRHDFRILGKEVYKYVDKQQFVVRQGENGWEVKGISGTTNPILLNGKEIGEEASYPLVNGDVLEIGGVRLTVRF